MGHPPVLLKHRYKKPEITRSELFFIQMMILLTLVGEENVNGNPSVFEYQRSCLHRLARPNTNLNAILIYLCACAKEYKNLKKGAVTEVTTMNL